MNSSAPHPSQPSRNIRIDTNLDSYQQFFDFDWQSRLFAQTQNTYLHKPALDLSIAWRGASNARMLPWLLIEDLVGFADRYMRKDEQRWDKYLEALENRIAADMEKGKYRLRTRQRKELMKVLRTVQQSPGSTDYTEKMRPEFEKAWIDICKNFEFQTALWMSTLYSYSGVYFAYEAFLIQASKAALKVHSIRADDLHNHLKKIVPKPMVSKCWGSSEITLAKKRRDAIVHNNGKVTDWLLQHQDQIDLEGDEVVFMPSDTNALYDLLKDRVFQFVQEAKKHPVT